MSKYKNITLKDVAKEAGVCYQTVSKVLNNKADWVSVQTRERVLEVVKKLGYEPNFTASTLRSGKRMTIGVISGAHFRHMGNIDLARYFAGIGQKTEEAGYYMTFMPQCCRLGDEEFAPRLRKAVKGQVVDGLIMLVFSHLQETFHRDTLPILKEGTLPLVVLQLNADNYDCPSVGFDIEAAGYQSTRHLLEQGRSDIACVVRDNPYGTDYYQGYCRALREMKAEVHQQLSIKNFNSVDGGKELAEAELKKGSLHQGYVICRDAVATGFIHALELAGKAVPADVAVVGCDNLIDTSLQIPTLTTIDRKFENHGYRAADMLFNIIDGKDKNIASRDIVAPELLVRKTSLKQ